ncbi:MAG: hypothetical protein V7K14_03675 [Nostoc sp.]|uniref:hypothetical protein n=1 Tax=Nostoc sp. TaxID=1180 RepID=UPI002FF7BC04
MTPTPPPKQSRLGTGYSYLFASILTALLVGQSTDIAYKKVVGSGYELSVATRELDPKIFYPCILAIFTVLGFPTDGIALAVGSFLRSAPTKKDDQEPN